MRAIRRASLVLGCAWLAATRAQEVEPVPDLDFLEYLGAWAEEDDEWLAIEEWRKDNPADADKDAEEPESETEREDDDESE